MTPGNHSPTPLDERPFAKTFAKCNAEHAIDQVIRTKFPYHEVRSLPGYSERDKPALAAVDVTNELARHLAEYSATSGSPLPYQCRDISQYVWIQASRGKLAWIEILNVVRAAQKGTRHKPISHYFGYSAMIETKGSAKNKRLIKLTRYVSQEGECAACQREFPFDHLTLDRITPGKAQGEYELSNVQLMCQPCNNRKGAE